MSDNGTLMTSDEYVSFSFDKDVFLTAKGMFVSGNSMARNNAEFQTEHEKICRRLVDEAKAGDRLSEKALAESVRRRFEPL